MHRKWLSLTITFLLILGLAMPLAAVAENGEDKGDNGEASYEWHPVARWLAGWLEDMDADDIMELREEYDVGFGEIMMAIRTNDILGEDAPGVGDLLEQKKGGVGWGQIWQEAGLIGRGRQEANEEEEEERNGPPEGIEPGPPEGAPKGPPEGITPGPPEDTPKGPPEGIEPGPPEGAPKGPPDGVPPGPPEGVSPGPGDDAPEDAGGPPPDVPAGPPGNGGGSRAGGRGGR
ncbi:MAG: hypothetical protein R6V13_10810 [Anaerolineae bacterium]